MNNRMVLLNPNFSQKDPADVEQQTDGDKEQKDDVEPVAEEHAEGGEFDEVEALASGGKEEAVMSQNSAGKEEGAKLGESPVAVEEEPRADYE